MLPDLEVSFPGKYSELWDEVVSVATDESRTISLACVFLTDEASGLGQHSEIPDRPGRCWCHDIYGEMDASQYLVIVDEDVESGSTLAWKRANAAAMHQILVVKSADQTEDAWHKELAEHRRQAERTCQQNNRRAPWGCLWFKKWKENVDRAVELHQTLHVFYFEGKVGLGKIDWDNLGSDEARAKAREEDALGFSQTAEVAYLDKCGFRYEEHDIADFKQFAARLRKADDLLSL